MLDRERESALLRQAVTRGLLTTIDIQTDRQDTSADHSTVRFGPRLDRLLAEGKLTSRQIATLSAELSAFDQTLDGTAQPALHQPHSEVISIQNPPWLTDWSAYEVLGVLGQGGMGVVYRARDRKLAREVALKFISSTDDQLRRRFLTEARSQARLNHEHICKIHEGCRTSDGIA